MTSDQCSSCNRYFGTHQCEAFPDRIPEEIMIGLHDHEAESFPGDHGRGWVKLQDGPDWDIMEKHILETEG